MTTEYEQLLSKMVNEKKAMLAQLLGVRGKKREAEGLASDIRFLEVELEKYQQSMSLFRTKGIPKVGRWGKAEAEESASQH
jgi:hypothetical protein